MPLMTADSQEQQFQPELSQSWQQGSRTPRLVSYGLYQHSPQQQPGDCRAQGSLMAPSSQLPAFLLPKPVIAPPLSFEIAVARHRFRDPEMHQWARRSEGHEQQTEVPSIQPQTIPSRQQYRLPTNPAPHQDEDAGHRIPPRAFTTYQSRTENTQNMSPSTSEKPQDDAKGTESRVSGRRRAMVMPNGSPVLTDASAIPIAPTSPTFRPHDKHQDCGHPESQNNCAFCLRSEADFNNCLVKRNEDGRWVSSWRQPVDLSGVPRRLFQSHRSKPTPDIERPGVEEVDDVLRDVISEGCEELAAWLVEDTP